MKRIRRYLYGADIDRFRFYVQILAFGVLMYGGYLAVDVGTQLPAFACPFASGAGGTCYLYPLQHQTNLPLDQLFGGRGIGLLKGLGGFLIFFLVLNKAWCGFVCPLGTVQDWMTRLRVRLKIRYANFAPAAFNRLKKVKYLLLVLLILLPWGMSNSLFGLPPLVHDYATPYCMVCPGRTVLPLASGDTRQMTVDFSSKTRVVLTALGMAVTGIFFAGAFFKRRFFCLFCPMSALQYVFSGAGMLRMNKDGSKCTRCGNCLRVCDVGIVAIAENLETGNIVQDDCMMCFKCVAACPEEECLTVGFLGAPLYVSTEEGFYRRAAEGLRSGTEKTGSN